MTEEYLIGYRRNQQPQKVDTALFHALSLDEAKAFMLQCKCGRKMSWKFHLLSEASDPCTQNLTADETRFHLPGPVWEGHCLSFLQTSFQKV